MKSGPLHLPKYTLFIYLFSSLAVAIFNYSCEDKSLVESKNTEFNVIEFEPEPNSPVTQRPLKELNIPEDCIIGMINHHGKIRIAHGTSILTEDDIALVFAKPKAVSKIKKLFLS